MIIIGMSRSGTSMLTRMLADLGLFVGSNLTHNHEALFFRNINDWLLTQCSGGLENPGTIRYLLADEEARALYGEFIRFTMGTPDAISFLGLRKYIKYRNPLKLDIPWGWKDPRNTFILPLWLDIFPDAKVIHIIRHPLDIVNSLKTRRRKGLSRLKDRHRKFKSLYRYYLVRKFIGAERVFTDLRGASLEEGLLMWEEYVEEARRHVSSLKEGAVEIRYEDFLENPVAILNHLVDFCGLDAGAPEIQKSAGKVNKTRGFAYLKNPELKSFSARVAERLKSYGY
ncbi:MAG: sulfotransferase [Deltaproteobacteria bacterium]